MSQHNAHLRHCVSCVQNAQWLRAEDTALQLKPQQAHKQLRDRASGAECARQPGLEHTPRQQTNSVAGSSGGPSEPHAPRNEHESLDENLIQAHLDPWLRNLHAMVSAALLCTLDSRGPAGALGQHHLYCAEHRETAPHNELKFCDR